MGRRAKGTTPRRPRWQPWALGLAIAAAVLILFHPRILAGVASFMSIRDPLERADLIFPLYQEGTSFAAARLYRLGYAPRIGLLVTRPGRLEALGLLPPVHETWRKVLERESVPPHAVVAIGSRTEPGLEPARVVAQYLAARRERRLILVASSPLSRLALDDFRRGLAGADVEIHVFPAPPADFDERAWWRSRHGWLTYFDVYVLWAMRFLR